MRRVAFSVGLLAFGAASPAWAEPDLQVVGQAATLAPEWYPIGGRAFLGLDPGPRLR